MRVLVTGSRDWTDLAAIAYALLDVTALVPDVYVTVVHGGARGADTLADEAAETCGWLREPHSLTRADWNRDGSQAGHIRNQLMVNLGADVCLAFVMPCAKVNCWIEPHDSHGTADCIARAKRAGIPVRTYHP